MKSNVRCWTPPAAVLLIVMLLLSACAMGGSDGHATCPPVVEYSAADRARAADEVDAMQHGDIVVRMLSDYVVLREQVQACP